MENVEPKIESRALEVLKRVQGSTRVVPVDPPAAPPQEPPKVIDNKAPDYDIKPKEDPTARTDSPLVAEPKKDINLKDLADDEDPSDEIHQLLDPKAEDTENFKKLRTLLRTRKKEYKTVLSQKEEYEKKVKDYETGLAVPEVVQSLQDRIAQMEVYEKLYNFKSTPVYQEKVVTPIQEERQRLVEIAKENGIESEVLEEAFASPEPNKILSRVLKDDVSIIEAKSVFKNIRKIQSLASELEKEPAQNLAKLQAENDRIVAEKRQTANEAIVTVSKDAWSESLFGIKQDGRFPHLVYREGDSEHNEKYVRPILTKAGQEYGRIVKTLAQHGLTELPKDLAIAFANMTQHAHMSAINAVEVQRLQGRVAELEERLNIQNTIDRPGFNSTAGNSTVGHSNGKAVGLENAAMNALNRATKARK